MFFIARTTAAMFTGSCGSCRTTRTRASGSATIDNDRQKTCGRLTVPLEIHPTAASAQDELPPAPHAIGCHFVDDDVHRERNAPSGAECIQWHLETHLVTSALGTPFRDEGNIGSRAIDRTGSHMRSRTLGHCEPGRRTIPFVRGDVELYPVAVNVGMLIVERRIWRLTSAKDQLLLLHGHDDDEPITGHGESDARTGTSGFLPRLLGPAVRALPELEPDRSVPRGQPERARGEYRSRGTIRRR